MENKSDNAYLRENILRILDAEGAESLHVWLRQSPTYWSEEEVSEAIASINSQFNLFKFLATMTEPDPRFAVNLVLEAAKLVPAPTLEDALNLIRFIDKIETAFSYQAIWILEEISKTDPKLMPELLLRIDEEKFVGEMPYLAWAGIYSKIYPIEAIELIRTIDVEQNANNLLRIALFNSLEQTAPNVEQFRKEFSSLISPSVIRLTLDKPDFYLAWQALCPISEICAVAAKHLEAISESNNPEAQGALLRWISQKRASHVTVENFPVKQMMLRMMSQAMKNPQLHMLFDAVVSQMLSRETTVLDGLAIFNALKSDERDPSVVLNLSCHTIFGSPKLFSQVLTGWLMAKDAEGCAIRAFLQQCNLGGAQCKFDDAIFQAGSFQDRKRAVMRIVAHTHNVPTLAKFTEDFAENIKKHPDGIKAANTLLEYIVQEYPDYALEFLDGRISVIDKQSPAYAIYKQFHIYAKAYMDAKNELPILKELAPTGQQQVAMHQREIRSQREISRISSEKSVMSQLAHRVTISQGGRVATLMHDGQVRVTEMHSMSYSIQLPISERADPLAGIIVRNNMLESAQ